MSRYRIKIPIFNEEWRNYFLSTHFLAPALNWAIPISSILDMTKDPKYISGNMTVALSFYSLMSMRFALRVNPRNMLLFACHIVNMNAQLVQGFRYLRYHNKLSFLPGPMIDQNIQSNSEDNANCQRK
ncbi:mitochondrial pyruvate carrier 1 isoform X1 [Neodiprion lecontei]|uniref:Mitochondrial pyruvate carrier n=1 Tax=Neodiprion lecontei TaxID=441921 RepID=A0A6J0BAG2_NEOLC|nr:mitochondrial pyruvate carrier 1 isoform X1 [Neodiprion lecontei]